MGGGTRAPTHDHSPEKQPWLRSPSLSALPWLVRAAHCWVLSKHLAPRPGDDVGLAATQPPGAAIRKGKALQVPLVPDPEAVGAAGRPLHFPFSFLLLRLWPVSSSSFLSSFLCSWARLAGSRDLSLVPLPG